MAMFDLNETQKQLFEMAKDFSNKEVWPKAKELDETAKFPIELLKKTHELGMLNAFVPEEVGGLGLGTFDHCLISEALVVQDFVQQHLQMILLLCLLFCPKINKFGKSF